MRAKMALVLLGLGLACQGCAPLWQSARSSLVQPLIYRRTVTDAKECHRNRELADAAWADFFSKHTNIEYTKDFECGFKEGFADYLYSGGAGAPPPVPPRCYWNYKYETPEGHKAIHNWFAGFREGAVCAKQSGYRQLTVVPASTCLLRATSQTTQPTTSSPSPASGTPGGAGPPTEELLPLPKPVPAKEDSSILGPPPPGPTPPPPVSSSGPNSADAE